MGDHGRGTTTRDGWNRAQFDDESTVASQVRRAGDGELFDQERRVFDRYLTRTDTRVLDLGCGTGRVTQALADRGHDVTGVDVSATLVRAAHSRLSDAAFVTADAADLPFATDAVDYVVFAYNGLDYLVPAAERRAALREARRVLRPSGTFVFSSHNTWYALPGLLADRDRVRERYLAPENRDRLFDPYKFETTDIGTLETYFTNPVRQYRELRATGFDLVDVVGRRPAPVCLFEAAPYYVATPA